MLQSCVRDLDDFEAVVLELKGLLRELERSLQETAWCGERFMSLDVDFFLSHDGTPGDAKECLLRLSQIRRTFQEIYNLQKSIGGLKETCEEMMKDGMAARKKVGLLNQHNPSHGCRTSEILFY